MTAWFSAAANDRYEPPPNGDRSADVVVIGGGLMGVAAAYWLSLLGVDVELLEARTLASGSSGRNPG